MGLGGIILVVTAAQVAAVAVLHQIAQGLVELD